MNSPSPHALRAAIGACLLAVGLPAAAQSSSLAYGLKLRSAVQVASQQDNLKGFYLGFGLEASYLADFGRIGAELGLLYKPGGFRSMDVSAMPYEGAVPVDPSRSVDMRKTQLDSLTLRLSYECRIAGLGWRGGLQIGAMKFREEYVADVQGTHKNGSATVVDYRDAYNGVNEKSKMALSPFVGVSLPLSKDQALELQVVALSYTSVTYQHVAGTVAGPQGVHNAKDKVVEANRMVPHLEVTYAITF